jgi:hypothetical protein
MRHGGQIRSVATLSRSDARGCFNPQYIERDRAEAQDHPDPDPSEALLLSRLLEIGRRCLGVGVFGVSLGASIV